MSKYMMLILLLLGCGLLTGCALEPEYNRARVAKVRTDAMIKEINNSAKLEDKHHEVRMMAAEIAINTERLIKETNIQLTEDANILAVNYKAADSLLESLPVELEKDNPILVATFLDLDDLSDSSTFGRVVSEHFASRFNQKGYTTIEMKLRANVFIKEHSGEFLLSREMEEISTKHRAQAVVVGTYAVASKKVYLTARVINVSDGRVLASYDYNVPIGHDTFKMLLKGKGEDKSDWL